MAVIRSRFSEQPTHRAVRLAVLAMSLAAAVSYTHLTLPTTF